jgi:hexokinase
VVILNDTVTTLLAGKSVAGDRNFSAYIGFILGTGTNCCYSEKNSNIIKTQGLAPTGNQIINIESGGFAKAPRGRIDLQFDNSTLDTGLSTFEKMISGAYLGPLCLEVARVAGIEGLFSNEAAEKLNAIKEIDTKDISDFMHNPNGDNPLALADADQNDIDTLNCLLEKLVDRAAKLTAINLSSVVLKTDAGKHPDSPVCIVAEGSTFYGLKTLKEKVEHYLEQYLENQKQRYYEIVNVENATLIGAAIAGLTN